FTQVLQRDSGLLPQHQEMLHTILQSGDHLLALINDVLHVSKIEANQITLQAAEFHLASFLDNLERMLEVQASNKRLDLTLEMAPNLPHFISVDQGKLRQILINLLGNALKFTERGWVQLQVCVLPKAPYDSGKSTNGAAEPVWLSFQIKDTGPGISEDALESIFEPFSQIHYQHVSSEGTGLGLTISRRYAELMGGQITVQSQLGVGSTFTFIVPTHPVSSILPPALASPGSSVTVLPGQPTRRVLIVDDVPSNRKVLTKLLMPLRWPLREASNGQEAIEIWRQWQPDLIWMDLRMPVMNGYEAIRQIREWEQAEMGCPEAQVPPYSHSPNRTRIIVLTAGTLENEFSRSVAVGCDDIVLKPLRQQHLFELLGKHFSLAYTLSSPTEIAPQTPDTATTLRALLPLQSTEWLQESYYAAMCCDDAALRQLLQRLSPEHKAIATSLHPLLYEFRFDDIVQLLQPFLTCSPSL
ncbi:MAG TPA: ATP-binding protein, partial [Leptolyngbyaceae cyanobacterium]